jgi:hypothetical protein
VDVRQCLPKGGGVTVFGGGHEGDLGEVTAVPRIFGREGCFRL